MWGLELMLSAGYCDQPRRVSADRQRPRSLLLLCCCCCLLLLVAAAAADRPRLQTSLLTRLSEGSAASLSCCSSV